MLGEGEMRISGNAEEAPPGYAISLSLPLRSAHRGKFTDLPVG